MGVNKHKTGEGWASKISRLGHGTGRDHTTYVLATHPVTQVGYSAVTVVVDKGKNTTVVVNCVSLVPFFLQVKINLTVWCNLCVYS
jgi:hypothetical protein